MLLPILLGSFLNLKCMVGEYEFVFSNADQWLDYYNDLEDHKEGFMEDNPEFIMDIQMRMSVNLYNQEEYIIRILVNRRNKKKDNNEFYEY